MPNRPVTVAELPPFTARAQKLWSETAKLAFIDFIARNPMSGDEIPGTGGLRKLRWGVDGKGKRGGARVIYYYYDSAAPIYRLTVYGKSEKADMTPDERKAMSALVTVLKQHIRKKRSKP
ncbi:addiction module toxin RelE [Ferrovibrio sp.]|uniref:addiction module toxin RelE n=1 Tax=Ferrovibrio sp. TaxID=1917215 RepID=UPI0035ADD17F